MGNGVRRVVSGQTADGKSTIVSDEIVEPRGNTITILPIWGGDTTPRFPLDGMPPGFSTFFPGPGGYRFFIFTIPPDKDLPSLPPPESTKIGTGADTYMEKEEPGMHTTDTIDFEVILSGEATQEFDGGLKIHLKTGDTFIQNGTRHRWSNRGDVPAVVAVVMVGGHPRERPTAA